MTTRWLCRFLKAAAVLFMTLPMVGCGGRPVYDAESYVPPRRKHWRPTTTDRVYDRERILLNNDMSQKLMRPMSVEWQDVPLEKAVKEVAEVTGARIHVNWALIKEAGIDQETPISVTVTDTGGADVLAAVVTAAAGQATKPLGYEVVDGIVVVSTRRHLDRLLRKRPTW